ncbi:phosphosulfolactate synthase [Cryomorphaceae bacterium 1068]|nr:phosphosulfolactate synthase [Cryomorphaceae bacterium 1068]
MNFNLPFIPERTERPRDNGLTMVMDKGLSLRSAANFLDANGTLTDIIKLGFGTSYLTKDLKEKIKLYHDADMKVYLGGTLFEAFIVRGMFDEYRKLLLDLKLETVEVSDGSIDLPHDEKLEFISKLAKDFTVLSEVGSKEEGILIAPGKWVKMMDTELRAGSWKVIAEARESGNVGIYRPNGTAHVVLVNKILARVKSEDILWEAPQKAQQVWFIKLIGHNVNLGNIAPNDVIPLETLRIGLRGDTFFEFLPEEIAANMRP